MVQHENVKTMHVSWYSLECWAIWVQGRTFLDKFFSTQFIRYYYSSTSMRKWLRKPKRVMFSCKQIDLQVSKYGLIVAVLCETNKIFSLKCQTSTSNGRQNHPKQSCFRNRCVPEPPSTCSGVKRLRFIFATFIQSVVYFVQNSVNAGVTHKMYQIA